MIELLQKLIQIKSLSPKDMADTPERTTSSIRRSSNVVKKALLEYLSPKGDVTTNLLNSKNPPQTTVEPNPWVFSAKRRRSNSTK